MPQAQLIFRPHHNSFSILVKNLENLSVKEIQKLQEFVTSRKGVFDFSSYTFSIQKKIGLEEFESLLASCSINAVVTEEFRFDNEPRVSFGQYKGMQYRELPDSYLLWLKSNYNGLDKAFIQTELKNRKL